MANSCWPRWREESARRRAAPHFPLILAALLAGAVAGYAGGVYAARRDTARFQVLSTGPNGIDLLRIDTRTGQSWTYMHRTGTWREVLTENVFDRFDPPARD